MNKHTVHKETPLQGFRGDVVGPVDLCMKYCLIGLHRGAPDLRDHREYSSYVRAALRTRGLQCIRDTLERVKAWAIHGRRSEAFFADRWRFSRGERGNNQAVKGRTEAL